MPDPSPTPLRAGWSTPLLHVADVERSIRFYEALGFETIDTHREGDLLVWARLDCEGGAVMLLHVDADEIPDPAAQGILLYLYTPDLPGLRSQLVASGLEPTAIRRPPYMPSGEIHLHDPDGYVVMVGHWGEEEHAAWLERIKAGGS